MAISIGVCNPFSSSQLLFRYLKERAHVDAVVAGASSLRELRGPYAVASALARFQRDDEMACAAATACARSLDIIEKLCAAHGGDAGEALSCSCLRLLISSGLPLQLFNCFCVRSRCLGNTFVSGSPRSQLLLQLLATTCKCVYVAEVRGVDVPVSLTAGLCQQFIGTGSQDRRPRCASLTHLMSLLMSQPALDSTSTAVLHALSLLLSHCIASELQAPDTSILAPVALHVMLQSPLLLMGILSPSNSSPHLTLPLALHSSASLLLVLASSHVAAASPLSPTVASAQLFAFLLLRFALILFARGHPHPAATAHTYRRVFARISASIEQHCPSATHSDRPLLHRLADDDDCGTPGHLIELYKQYVLADEAAASACSTALQAGFEAARSAAVADAAVELVQAMHHIDADDGGHDAARVPERIPATAHDVLPLAFRLLPRLVFSTFARRLQQRGLKAALLFSRLGQI
jgi:hypothetical protein